MAGNNTDLVTPVTVDGHRIGCVFGTGADSFCFVLDDERDMPRGGYESASDAQLACESQWRCIQMADRWEPMVDT